MTPLFKKLNLADNKKILVLNPPKSFEAAIAELDDVKVVRRATSESNQFAIAFATTVAELLELSEKLVKATTGDATVWVAYPKKSSKNFDREFNRDTGDWSILGAAEFEPVRQVAIDEDWSALRFRKTTYIESLTRSNSMAISKSGKRRTK